MSTEDPPVDVDLIASSLSADAGDVEQFAELLAGKLEEALPRYTRVERRRAGMLGPKRVRRMTIALPRERLELALRDGLVETSSARVSGGIALKHESLDLDEWLHRLSEALAAEAERSQAAEQALRKLLI